MISAVLERLHVPDEPSEQRAASDVAGILREIRKSIPITQEEAARRLNMTLSGYRAYEQGKRQLRVDQIERFAQAFGVPVSEITSRLWPADQRLVALRFSTEEGELLRQVEGLPDPIREMVLRAWRHSLEIAHGASDLARRN